MQEESQEGGSGGELESLAAQMVAHLHLNWREAAGC